MCWGQRRVIAAIAAIAAMTALCAPVVACHGGADSTGGNLAKTDAAPWDGGPCNGSACVRPKTIVCRPGGPRAAFVSQSVPTSMPAYEPTNVAITFANCSDEPWDPMRWILLPSAPLDNFVWGQYVRVGLPSAVPIGDEVTFSFKVQPSGLLGKHMFSWTVYDTTVGPVPAESLAVEVEIVAPIGASPAELCAGVTADSKGETDASAALQKCIDATISGGVLVLPTGIYRIDKQVRVTRPMTIRSAVADATAGCMTASIKCAVLRAGPSFGARNGMLVATGTNHVTLDHLVFDGDRDSRRASAAAASCLAGAPELGTNAGLIDCARCSLLHSVSARALCGPSIYAQGDDLFIAENTFYENGGNDGDGSVSSGLLVAESARGIVQANLVRDSTDVGIWIGGLVDGVVSGNSVVQVRRASFAGMMLDDLADRTSGDFRGASITGNVVSCGGQCDYGLQVGPHAFYPTKRNVLGGTITGNVIYSAKINLDVFGAGTSSAPVSIFHNTMAGAPASAVFGCGAEHSCSDYNIAPDSVVDHKGDPAMSTAFGDLECR